MIHTSVYERAFIAESVSTASRAGYVGTPAPSRRAPTGAHRPFSLVCSFQISEQTPSGCLIRRKDWFSC